MTCLGLDGAVAVMVGLVPTIHRSTGAYALGEMNPRDKPEDDMRGAAAVTDDTRRLVIAWFDPLRTSFAARGKLRRAPTTRGNDGPRSAA